MRAEVTGVASATITNTRVFSGNVIASRNRIAPFSTTPSIAVTCTAHLVGLPTGTVLYQH